MLEYINCNLCGGNKTKILISKEPFNIVQCKKCGLIYTNPRPSEDTILEYFITDRVIAEHKKAVWYNSKLDLFKKNLRRIERYSPKGRLLDVGCGYGIFLKMAEEKNWQTWGVEISNSAYKYAKQKVGLNIFKGTLKEAHFSDNYFDVITLWDVLDELSTPFNELLEINRILKRNGLLVFRVRNATFHLKAFLLFKNLFKKLKVDPTVFHLYAFSAKAAKMMLKKAGFKVIKVMNSELTVIGGTPSCTGEIFNQPGMKLIKKITYFLSQFIFYLTAGLLIVGPSLLVFAKKPQGDFKKDYAKD